MIHDGGQETGAVGMACFAGFGGRDMILRFRGGSYQSTYGVASGTVFWRTFESPSDVAGFASNRKVGPF